MLRKLPKRKSVSALVIALTAAFVAAVGLAACGGGAKTPSAKEIVDKTFGTHTTKVKSGNISLNLNVTGQNITNLTKPLTVKLGGPFESTGDKKLPKFDLNLDLTSEGQSFSAGAVSTGDKAYVKFQGTAYEIPSDIFNSFKQGFEQGQQNTNTQTNAQTQPGLAALGIDPKSWLTNVQVQDNVQVAGTNTYHVSAQVSVDAIANDLNTIIEKAGSFAQATGQGANLPKKLSQTDLDKFKQALQNPTIDLYAGKDDFILRKLSFKAKITNPDDTKQTADLTLDVELNNLNQPQTINAPPNAKPLSDLLQQLGLGGLGNLGNLGGATGGGGGGKQGGSSGKSSGGTNGAPTPPPVPQNIQKQSKKYLDCVSTAKSPEDLQKCVALLQGGTK